MLYLNLIAAGLAMTVPFKQSIDGQFTMSRVRASNPDGTFTFMTEMKTGAAGPEVEKGVVVSTAAVKESIDGQFQRSMERDPATTDSSMIDGVVPVTEPVEK